MNEDLSAVPNGPELLFIRGRFHEEEGRRDAALADLAAIREETDGFRSLDIGLITAGRDALLRELLS